ncbi:MAG: nucleotidyltransferase family protein [Bacteroidales bacterium]
MKRFEKLYLQLLGSALNESPLEHSNFIGVEPQEWKSLLALSNRQRTTAFIVTPILSLPKELHPPKGQLLKLQLECGRIEEANNSLNLMIAFLKREFDSIKVPLAILKGQGVAQNYPQPNRRTPGDIDLFFYSPKEYQRVKEWILAKGYHLEKEGKIHQGFNIGRVHIEAHKRLTHFRTRRLDSIFDREFRTVVERGRWQRVAVTATSKGESASTTVELLPPTFNAAYLFIHLFRHFVSTGISMRHICDWTLHLSINRHRIELEEVERILKEFNLLKPAQLVAEIAVRQLGAPPQIFPTGGVYPAQESRGAQLLLNDILKGGDFGKYHKGSIRPKGVWAGRAHSYIHFLVRSIKLASIAPGHILAHPISRAVTRLKLIFNPS